MLLSSLLQSVFHGAAFAAAASISSSAELPSATTSNSAETFTQIPSTAAGPVIPYASGYRTQALGEGSYMVTDGSYQALFFVAPESVIAVDAPPTIGEYLLYAIRNVTTKPVSHLVYSHSHADHIGAAYLYGNNITIVAHELTAQLLALSPDPSHRPAPTITFESSYTLNVGNQTLQLDYRGPNHEPGNIFIYAHCQKILMVVDIVYPGFIPFDALGEVQNVPGYIIAHDQILTYKFDYYIGGHLNRPGNKQDVLIAREYLHDLYDTAVLAVNLSATANSSLSVQSAILPAVEEAGGINDPWVFFSTYTDFLTDWITEQLEEKWSNRLYAYSVYAKSHANVMLSSVRIDFGTLGPFGHCASCAA